MDDKRTQAKEWREILNTDNKHYSVGRCNTKIKKTFLLPMHRPKSINYTVLWRTCTRDTCSYGMREEISKKIENRHKTIQNNANPRKL